MDLGEELADFQGDCPPYAEGTLGPLPPRKREMQNRGRLADLQAEGFNRTPLHPGQVPPMWGGDEPGSTFRLTAAMRDANKFAADKFAEFTAVVMAMTKEVRCAQCRRYLPGVTLSGGSVSVLCGDCTRMKQGSIG